MDSKDIDYLGREAEKLPRFLFRGFHSLSGGGQTGLNTAQGVVPHGFLYEDSSADSADSDSSDSSHGMSSITVEGMDFEDLAYVARKHICGGTFPTPFSSWASNFESAVLFAIGAVPTGGM